MSLNRIGLKAQPILSKNHRAVEIRATQNHTVAQTVQMSWLFLHRPAKTEDEALDVIVALVQLYREQGHYLERIYKWTRRVGVDSIKAAVVDDLKKRNELFERFVYAQKFSQSDPWKERTEGRDAHEFKPMSEVSFAEAAE